jgi:hypothetical protein
MLILSKLASSFFPVITDALAVDAMHRVGAEKRHQTKLAVISVDCQNYIATIANNSNV